MNENIVLLVLMLNGIVWKLVESVFYVLIVYETNRSISLLHVLQVCSFSVSPYQKLHIYIYICPYTQLRNNALFWDIFHMKILPCALRRRLSFELPSLSSVRVGCRVEKDNCFKWSYGTLQTKFFCRFISMDDTWIHHEIFLRVKIF